jgi:ABC-2 type transport system ATP-binding protein
MTMIELSGITKTFRGTRILDNLTLTIGVGERVALIGANGAGKTTLIRCLLGEYTHDGVARVHGLDPRRDRGSVLSLVGFVPQLPPPLRMPVAELIRFAAGVSKAGSDNIIAIARRLGLDFDDLVRRPFVKLSGGQKQKLLIAIALGRDCSVLILDEAAANLDPSARRVFFELLAERRDVAMIISSHRLDEVAPLVNRVVEMERGRIVLDDRTGDIPGVSTTLHATVRIARPEAVFAEAMRDWQFTPARNDLTWHGVVAGRDRLRFIGTLARFAGLLTGLSLDHHPQKGDPNVDDLQDAFATGCDTAGVEPGWLQAR